MMKQLDTYTYVSALRELVASGQTVSVRIAGNSMAPFLVDTRDSICFRAPDRPFRRGDMVFYQRETGQYVMHRIARVRPEGCYLVGDAQQLLEGPIAPEQIFAVVVQVQRKGTWIDASNFWWKFFAEPWLTLLPLRRVLLRLYSVFLHR